VVIPGTDNPFGVLAVISREGRTFGSEEVKFLQAVANVIGVAVERARVQERLESARESERARIALELHDEGLRELSDAVAVASLAQKRSADQRDDQDWTAMTVALRRIGQQLRSAIYDLRLGDLEDRGFVELLDDLVAVEADLAIGCQLELYGVDRLPTGSLGRRGTEILRIVREAIMNARRHSGATVIRVDADASTRDYLRIEVCDDGEWADRDAIVVDRRGTGVTSMLARADELRAALRIEGLPTGGTRVSLEVPLSGSS
jgi:signal transduction histidine kinase